MILALQPASHAQFVRFGNIGMQDLLRASTWGIGSTALDAYHDLELQPASHAKFVRFGNIGMQDLLRAST